MFYRVELVILVVEKYSTSSHLTGSLKVLLLHFSRGFAVRFLRLRRSLLRLHRQNFITRLQYRQLRYTILVANMHPPRMDFVLTKRPEMEREQVYMKINLAPCLDNPYPDYLQEVFSAPTNSWALVPHFIWDNYVYSSKIWSAVPKMVQT